MPLKARNPEASLFLPLDHEANRSHDPKYKELIVSLPLETRWPTARLRLYKGFWFPEGILPGVLAFHDHFSVRPNDVFLGSFPKSGTTLLKALAFSTINRDKYPLAQHPLLHLSPHDCVPFIDMLFAQGDAARIEAVPSPRVVSLGHMSYSMLPKSITDSDCPIVYICRDPKDVLVSNWSFNNKVARENNTAQPITFEQAFELFCDGRSVAAPLGDHVLEYWNESLRKPKKVLFLKYEDMMEDPKTTLKKLAEFVNRPFSKEEEKEGVLEEILELCSFEKLKNLQVNKQDDKVNFLKNGAFFRKGVVGDWRSHMTSEMADMLDKIVQEKLQGSGLALTRSS